MVPGRRVNVPLRWGAMLTRIWLIGASPCLLAACVSQPARSGAAPIDLFTTGESSHAVYCIPAATRLASGRLLVLVEVRESSNDNGSNDFALKRSDTALFTV
jgi:hypothetical protein